MTAALAAPMLRTLGYTARAAFIIGIVAVLTLVAAYFLNASGRREAVEGWLTAWWYFLGISLGSLVVLMIHGLTGGRWARHVERPLRCAAERIPLLALLCVPLLLTLDQLYPWANHALVSSPEILDVIRRKSWYLDRPFFIARNIIFLVAWILLALRFRSSEPRSLRAWCVIGLLTYSFTITFAAVDWLMSLVPQWYSTTFGMLTGVGQSLSGFAFGITATTLLPHLRSTMDSAPREELQDLGNLILTAVMLWAYLAFTEYLVIWAEDLRHENAWHLPRMNTSWHWLGVVLILFQFAIPLLVLLFRQAKRRARIMLILGATLLAVHWLDCVWAISPSLHPEGLQFHWPQLAALLAIGGLWLSGVCTSLARDGVVADAGEPVPSRVEKAHG